MRNRVFNGSKNPNGGRDYKTAVIDGGIVAGFTFFTSLIHVIGAVDPMVSVAKCGAAAGLAFFASMMASLNIRKPAEPSP